jgi:GAF domain-containing protein
MRPIEQTVEAVGLVSRYAGETDLLKALQDLGDKVQELVPDCVGLSIAWAEHGVTFTLVASEEEIAVLDAIQYFDGGPCVDAVHTGRGIETGVTSPLEEEQWRLFAQATAAAGIRSTLSLPMVDAVGVVGSVNLYGASGNAFEDHHEELAEMLGGWAPGAVRNADLSFNTRAMAEQAPQSLRAEGLITRAIGMIVARQGTDVTTAHELLHAAANLAGIRPEQLAEALIQLGS